MAVNSTFERSLKIVGAILYMGNLKKTVARVWALVGVTYLDGRHERVRASTVTLTRTLKEFI